MNNGEQWGRSSASDRTGACHLRHQRCWPKVGGKAGSNQACLKAACGLEGSGATSNDALMSMNERHELVELRREFKQVHQEREIWEKATAWFAGRLKLA